MINRTWVGLVALFAMGVAAGWGARGTPIESEPAPPPQQLYQQPLTPIAAPPPLLPAEDVEASEHPSYPIPDPPPADEGLGEYPAWNGYDLDCPDVGHSVRVPGRDPHRLDRDGDGVGCEG
jgi:micrococcal nuclease